MSRFFTKDREALSPYTPGEQPRDKQYTKLNTNESPFPPSPWVEEALKSEEIDALNLYSDPACTKLRAAIATHFDIPAGRIMCGNGSDEILGFAFRAFCGKERAAAFPDITYGFYEVWCRLWDVPYRVLPLAEDFSLELAPYMGTGDTLFLANPNAPTGLAHPRKAMEAVIASNPDRVVVVDEAYVDFGAESCLPLVEQYPNLVVVQTFSKSRSLAGARLGFAVAQPALIEDLNRIKFSFHPYSVNRLTEAAGAAAILDNDYFQKCTEAIVKTRENAKEELRGMGFTVLESKTNFLFARTPELGGAALYEALKKRGILVRHFTAPRIEDWNRITVGSEEEMQHLLFTVSRILTQAPTEG